MSPVIPTQIIPSIEPSPQTPRQVARAFASLLTRATVRPAGEAKDDAQFLVETYPPRHVLELFGTRIFLTDVMKNPAVGFFIAYVVVTNARGRTEVHPRIFYKDISLVWRVASHVIATDQLFWIGKGAVERVMDGDHEVEHSVESTTDLPLEMQHAIEDLSRRSKNVRTDDEALYLVLRNGPEHRIAPYHDFSGPMERAASNPKNRIGGGKRIARFTRANDPTSLRIRKGYEPDFSSQIDITTSRSATYGGDIQRVRFLSTNGKIQWFFFVGAEHVWIVPPQALTTELSSYGVRTVHVYADDQLFVPGYEYHFVDEGHDVSEHFSQIPEGFAGAPHEFDSDRADASAWIEKLPVVVDFRRAWRAQSKR